jgi:hypothetical protein
LLDLSPPRPAPAKRSRVSWGWIAAAGAAALLVAIASSLLPTIRDGDGIDAAFPDTPPIATEPAPGLPSVAAPAPVPPPAEAPPSVADAGIGSIEFLGAIPAAPDPEPEMSASIRAFAPTPDRTPAEAETPAAADDLVVEGVIESGEWLAASFRRNDIPAELASLIAREMGDAVDFRHSYPGDRYRVTRNRTGELVAFEYEAAGNDIVELRLEDGRYRLRPDESR